VSESFDVPHIFITEETKAPFNPIRRRARVQAYRDAHLDTHFTTQSLYNADHEGKHEHEHEAGPSASVWSEDSSHLDPSNDHQYQDLYTIPEESEHEEELRDPECCTIPEVEDDNNCVLSEHEAENDGTSRRREAGYDMNVSIWSHGDDGTSPIAFSNTGSSWTAPSATSIFFCPPTPSSTLAPLTPSGSESGPSTPCDTPVLVHESASYEDALFSEFKAIIAQTGIEDDVDGMSRKIRLHVARHIRKGQVRREVHGQSKPSWGERRSAGCMHGMMMGTQK
jgi:hypothetical protein